MDNDIAQKIVQRDRAEALCRSAKRSYIKACNDYDILDDDNSFLDCMFEGYRLFKARETFKRLAKEVDEAQVELEEARESTAEESLAVLSPYPHIPFNRFSLYTYLVVMGLIGIAVLVASAVSTK